MLRVSARGQILYANYPTHIGLGKRHAGCGFRSARRVFDACLVECNPSRTITEAMQARHGAAAQQSRMEAARWHSAIAAGISAHQNNGGTNSGGALCELWGLSIGWAGVIHCVTRFATFSSVSISASDA